jgi:transposase InsO family protein
LQRLEGWQWGAIRPFASTRKGCNCARSHRVDARWWRRDSNAFSRRRSTKCGDPTSCRISFSREALAIHIGKRLRGEHVVEVLNRLVAWRRAPEYTFVDNGSEFTSQLLALWTHHLRVTIDFSRPGKPTDNSFVETFRILSRRMPERALVRNRWGGAGDQRA